MFRASNILKFLLLLEYLVTLGKGPYFPQRREETGNSVGGKVDKFVGIFILAISAKALSLKTM